MDRRLRFILRSVLLIVGGLIITWLAVPSPLLSSAWTPSPTSPLEGPLEKNDSLLDAELLYSGRAVGAADVVFDDNGDLLTGLSDGRIVRFVGDRMQEVAQTGGRPLGMQFGPDKALYVADAVKGLLRVSPGSGQVQVLVDEAEGHPFRITNDVTVDSQGVVYFTDSSAAWEEDEMLDEILDQRPTGRLLRYDPASGQTLVLARELAFANGVALAADESFILVAEMARYRVWRVWLQGEQKNLKEVFLHNLPGFPDDVTRSPRGTWWVSFWSLRKQIVDFTHPYPFLKDAIASLPPLLRPRPVSWGLVLEVDRDGKPIRALHDPTGARVPSTTSAVERDGMLWMGLLDGDRIARLRLQ